MHNKNRIEIYWTLHFKNVLKNMILKSRHRKPLPDICNKKINYWYCFLNMLKVQCAICTNLGSKTYNSYKVNKLLNNNFFKKKIIVNSIYDLKELIKKNFYRKCIDVVKRLRPSLSFFFDIQNI